MQVLVQLQVDGLSKGKTSTPDLVHHRLFNHKLMKKMN